MAGQSAPRRSYGELLEQLITCFPHPTSNPIMDGYFIHTLSRFLDRVDGLKSAAPLLSVVSERPVGEAGAFPEETSTVEAMIRLLAEHCEGMLVWAHPNAMANVVPASTIPGVMAFIASALYNPNIIWDEYSAGFARAEVEAVALLADLVGYDPRQAGGMFTFGGTGTILYGCKLGLEKLFDGRLMADGLREDVKIVTSDVSHYSRLNVAGWLGVGTKNLVTIPTTRDNEMSLAELEAYLRGAFSSGEKVAAIVATMGTTDAFGIDDLAAIVHLRDRLAEEYAVAHPPHIHADAVIGWVWAVFRDYDFDDNPLGFHARTLRSLRDSLARIGDLALADSLGIDLHKTGYTPYISSAFLVKNHADLTLLRREPGQMPYLYQFGQYHPGFYTLECSRAGASAMAALANIHLFGKEGYRVLIGHVVEMAEMLRERLERCPCITVLNDYNYGPVTLFRVYPDGVDSPDALKREFADPAYREELERHNRYNERIFSLVHERAMRGEGVLLSRTDAYRHANYPDGPPIAALKSFIMSPWTDLSAIEKVVSQVLEARGEVEY